MTENSIIFHTSQEILRLCHDGEIYLKGRLIETDKELVDGLWEVVGYHKKSKSELQELDVADLSNFMSINEINWETKTYLEKAIDIYSKFGQRKAVIPSRIEVMRILDKESENFIEDESGCDQVRENQSKAIITYMEGLNK